MQLNCKWILKFKGGIGIWNGRRDSNTSLASTIPSNTTNFSKTVLQLYCTLINEHMVITTKDSILKKYYEMNGQQSMFGYDNLEFKTINHLKLKQR